MRLFFYGVLLGSVAEGRVRDLLQGIGPGQAAAVRGELFAVPDSRGAYPVLVPGEGEVRGMVHGAAAVDLEALDRFEDAHRPEGEYRRQPLQARLESGERVLAEAYFYNRPIGPGLLPIPHGDFARWLRETGARPFVG